MTIEAMREVVAKMVVSDEVRCGVLAGDRATLLKDYDLSPEERRYLMGIQAKTLAEFAQAVQEQIDGQQRVIPLD